MFGFSRGAYTARSLCGFIKVAGLLERPSRPDVWRAYIDLYALQYRDHWTSLRLERRARRRLVPRDGRPSGRPSGRRRRREAPTPRWRQDPIHRRLRHGRRARRAAPRGRRAQRAGGRLPRHDAQRHHRARRPRARRGREARPVHADTLDARRRPGAHAPASPRSRYGSPASIPTSGAVTGTRASATSRGIS